MNYQKLLKLEKVEFWGMIRKDIRGTDNKGNQIMTVNLVTSTGTQIGSLERAKKQDTKTLTFSGALTDAQRMIELQGQRGHPTQVSVNGHPVGSFSKEFNGVGEGVTFAGTGENARTVTLAYTKGSERGEGSVSVSVNGNPQATYSSDYIRGGGLDISRTSERTGNTRTIKATYEA